MTGKIAASGSVTSLTDRNGGDPYVDLSETFDCSTPCMFNHMFLDCSSLTVAPELPALIMAHDCYFEMFKNCTSLETAPVLPSKDLAPFCYYHMFDGCSSIISAPELPATELASSCYAGMFDYCESLMFAPDLPATKLADNCYYYMFAHCSLLFAAPELPATELASCCYEGMFSVCTYLTAAPELPATKLASNCYTSMFCDCDLLSEASELPALSLAPWCYSGMFSNCISLTDAPELPATKLAEGCYNGMFSGCSSLIEAPELPATMLADYCYRMMFYNCTSLTVAPELLAVDLPSLCYNEMFVGCRALTVSKTDNGGAKATLTNASKDNVTNMFSGTRKSGVYDTPASGIYYIGKARGVSPFSDVSKADYFYDSVVWAVKKHITNGTSETTFSPEEICTRGQIVTFLWRACGSPVFINVENPFTDVSVFDYYYNAVIWAIELGITNGTSATTFSPDESCTRAQAVTFLWRAMRSSVEIKPNPFTDIPDGEYYTEAVLWAVSAGITNGTTETTFEPDTECTRGQIVTLLYRRLGK